MLKHIPRSGMDFLLHIFNVSCTLHFFLLSERHLLLFPSIKWERLSTFLLPFGLSLPPPASQSYLNASFYSVYSSFWRLTPFSLTARQVSTLDDLLLIKIFNKPEPGNCSILATIDFSKAFDSIWHPVIFHKLISAGLPTCFDC